MKISRPLSFYFFLAYLFSWIVFILLALNHHGLIHLFTDNAANARVADIWHAFGGLGPALSALITLKVFFTKKNFQDFLKSYSPKRITPTGWILAFSPLLYLAFAIVISGIFNKQWFSISHFFQENNLLTPFNLFAWLLPSFSYGIFEEAGWRGFAIPVLQTKYSALVASTILTMFWVGWHVPSFFYRYQLSGPMLLGLILGIYAGSLYLTHLFNFTKGSLLVVTIWHITWDIVSMIGKEGMIAAIMSSIIMLLAVVVLVKYKGRNLSPFTKTVLHGPR
ncbi:MAG TPA: CPBP family intramembrane glutamic endopeptidase [Chitinophagaceae bacterium]|nr:CPBP family intramembrane glutamic endopeptidase [Chitinophagaceae bacterium]